MIDRCDSGTIRVRDTYVPMHRKQNGVGGSRELSVRSSGTRRERISVTVEREREPEHPPQPISHAQRHVHDHHPSSSIVIVIIISSHHRHRHHDFCYKDNGHG
jgi:hypothetical protein